MRVLGFPVSSWIYLTIAGLAVVNVVVDWDGAAPLSAGLVILFLVIELPKSPATPRAIGLTLIGLGLIAAAYGGDLMTTALDGFSRSRTFLLLFFAVSWLQIPARESPSLQAAREMITSQPPGRRFLAVALGVHTLGAVLNLAGLSLVATMIEKKMDGTLRKRLTTALMLGFTSASCWSPFYVSMTVVLTAIPGLQWIKVAPFGFAIAMVAIAGGWIYDRLIWRRISKRATDAPAKLSAEQRKNTMGILGVLGVLVVGLVEVAGVSIPVALGLIAPPFSLIWVAAMAPSAFARRARMGDLIGRVVNGLPDLRNEVLVFVGATVFGVGIATLIPAADLSEFLNTWVPSIDMRLAILTFGICALGMIGMHPVIVVILIGEVLPPEVLGVPDWIMGLALLGVWGLSTMINPFSATTLYLARVGGGSGYTMAWRWNPPFVFIATGVVTAGVVALRHLAM